MVLNIIAIKALRKISYFPKPLKTLLISLAVSDLGVGLLRTAFLPIYCVRTASFLGIFALTVDRFLAIHLHLRYQELVTYRRVVAVVISVWVFSSCISLFVLNRI
ncbi:unnamed protein product [Porites evermanni]|uniref:G-protein coupled receptors family 1 profile domain-containing protein n=1 Tax=Porites evermanni TaxID=104178 RepID=A0ABN8M713_9CNID|nr:unnamed protein product [Porites evermanni]